MKKLLHLSLLVVFSISYSQNYTLKKVEDITFQSEVEKARAKAPNGIVRCATHEHHLAKQAKGKAVTDEAFEAWIAPKIEEVKKMRAAQMLPAVIRIPVVVHVIHNGDALGAGENISDAQVLSQIQVLNNDFRRILGSPGAGAGVDTTIEFCMAQRDPNGNPTNGIDRRNLGLAGFDQPDIEGNMKPNTIWDPTKYFNMWTCRFAGGLAANQVLGYAQFPSGSGLAGMPEQDCITGEASTDGFVARFDAFGSRLIVPGGTYSGTQFDEGRTSTHEIGHMFGLRHTWGDGDCTVDDFCADTPNCSAAFYAGESTGGCNAPVQCGNTRQIENYMDYSDDQCMSIFTQDQRDRMLAVILNSPRRDDLLVSNACSPVTASIQYKRVSCETRYIGKDIVEGNGCGYTDHTIPLNISKAPTQNAVVTFAVDGATTASALDFQIMTPTVTFNSGATADKNLVVRVYQDDLIEPNEDIVISFTVNANGGDAYAHTEGSTIKMTIANDDIASSTTLTLINEDFESANDWGIIDGDGDGLSWDILGGTDGFGTAPNTLAGKCAFSEKNLVPLRGAGSGSTTPNNFIISPQITIPSGASAATLTYIMAGYSATAGDYTVYFTPNASTVANITAGTILTGTQSIGSGASVLRNHNLAAHIGQTGYIVFRHANNNARTGVLLLDTINVTATIQVQTANNVATQFQTSLNTTGTVYAKDATSKKVIADVTSNTNFNYGCTTVAVTRDLATAGAAAVNYGSNTANNLKVMAKSVTVTPTNVSTTGTGTIKFFLTNAEVTAWEGLTGNSRNALRVIKQGTSPVLGGTVLGTFGGDVTLTANVTNGLGGVYYFGVDATLGKSDYDFTSFNLYPNPNKGNFTIELQSDSSDKIQVNVVDMRGRQIYNRSFDNTGLFNQNINLENTQAGVYLISITDGVRKTVKRIIIE